MIKKLIEIGRRCGMEMNVVKPKWWKSLGSRLQYRLWTIKSSRRMWNI